MRPLLPLLLVPLAAFSQNFDNIKVERVAQNRLFTEGPVWSPDGYLLFSDVPKNLIVQLAPNLPLALYRDNANGPSGNALDAQGRLYTCETHARRVTRTDRKGRVEILADAWQGRRLNAPSHIAIRKDGQVYFTDPAFGNQRDSRELDFYGVFHIPHKGEMEIVAKPRGRPHGVALSPNGRVLYISNADERNIRAYDLDRAGAASNERVFIAGIPGIPAGLRTDEKGNLYVAAKGVLVYSPEGRLLVEVPLSEKPSNLTFGDADLQTLYITAHTSVYRIRLDVKGSVQY